MPLLAWCAALLQNPSPIEFGRVRWEREFDAAATRARDSGKPLFVLFQEVPG